MDAPVRYVRSRDGTRIAYTVEGQGPPLVWLTAAIISHVQRYPQLPGVAAYLAEIAAKRTLIRMDFRGTGMADRDLEDHGPEAVTDDLEAVVDDLGLRPADIVAQGMRVVPAVRFANRRPESVRTIVFAMPIGPLPVAEPGAGVAGLVELMRSDW
ncbi:MAG: alpha/beta fold hydrolase, partial [Tepidiformaceae bacterium]